MKQTSETRTKRESDLRELLVREAENVASASLAFEQIIAAIAEYEELRPPIREADGITLHDAPLKAALRDDMAEVTHALEHAEKLIHALPRDSRRAFARASGYTFRQLDTVITDLTRGARRAVRKIDRMPNKPTNAARFLLAAEVARVIDKTLGITPTTTLNNPHTKRSRGGGAYDRILRATLAVVGITQCSTQPIMKAGLSLLNDPDEARGDRVTDTEAEE